MPKNKFVKLHQKSSASKKAPTTQPSAAASTNSSHDSSWKPTEGCVCPDGCINGSPIDPENPGDSVPLLCSNDEKCTMKSLFLHPECMEKWEEELWPYCHQGSNTNRLGDAGAWFNKHRQTVLWNKNQGYSRIRRFCNCSCGGFLKRDLNVIKSEEDRQSKAGQPGKRKCKAPSAALPEMNKEGLGGPRGTLRNFVQRPKQKCDSATRAKPVHFWEQSAGSKPKKAPIVGQTKPASPIPPLPLDKAQEPDPFSAQVPQAQSIEIEETELNDAGVFLECLKEVLRRNGGSVEKEGEVMESFLDRVSPPLTSQIFSLTASPVEWILIFGAPDIFLDGDRITLSGAFVDNGPSLEDGEGEEWTTVGGGERGKGVSESHPPRSSSNSVDSGVRSSPGDKRFLSVYERDMTGMRTDEYAVGHEDLIFLFNLMGFKFNILHPDKEPEEDYEAE